MNLTVTRNIPEPVRAQITADCRPIIEITEQSEFFAKAVMPTPAEVLQLLGNALEWFPLKAAATVFLSQLAKNAADDVWKNKARITAVLTDTAVAPLRRVAAALARARQMSPGPPTVTIGLRLPDDFYGTAVTWTPDDVEESAWVLACFAQHATAIEAFVRKEMEAGRLGRGGVRLLLQRDGSFDVIWMHPESREEFRRRIP